jgi:DNA-directed RNA polymerase subunit RPC12/RpoP
MEHLRLTNLLYQGEDMKRTLRMKCPSCGHWNRILVNKLFVEQLSPEPKVKVMIPMYEPLQASKCEKCGKIIAEPKELIRIVKKA